MTAASKGVSPLSLSFTRPGLAATHLPQLRLLHISKRRHLLRRCCRHASPLALALLLWLVHFLLTCVMVYCVCCIELAMGDDAARKPATEPPGNVFSLDALNPPTNAPHTVPTHNPLTHPLILRIFALSNPAKRTAMRRKRPPSMPSAPSSSDAWGGAWPLLFFPLHTTPKKKVRALTEAALRSGFPNKAAP